MAGQPPQVTMQVQAIPAGKRRQKHGSTLLLHEWASMRYPTQEKFYELRLGPTRRELVGVTVSPALEAALRVANWYADLLVIDGDELVVIEAKVAPDPSAVGQVLWYSTLIRSTPSLATYATKAVTPVVLWAERDDSLNAWVRSMGVRVELYTPPWIGQYLAQRQFPPPSPS